MCRNTCLNRCLMEHNIITQNNNFANVLSFYHWHLSKHFVRIHQSCIHALFLFTTNGVYIKRDLTRFSFHFITKFATYLSSLVRYFRIQFSMFLAVQTNKQTRTRGRFRNWTTAKKPLVISLFFSLADLLICLLANKLPTDMINGIT